MNYDALNRERELAAFTSHVLSILPREEALPKTHEEVSPQVFRPTNFDEIFSAQEDLRAHRLVIPRLPSSQALYERVRTEPNKFNEQFGMDMFEYSIKFSLSKRPIIISQLSFPYAMPPDAYQYSMWYRPEVSLQDQAKHLAETFSTKGITERDFVIIQNPTFARSVPQFLHKHLFIRAKEGYQENGPGPLF